MGRHAAAGPKSKWTKAEFTEMVNSRGSNSDHGRDAVHLAMQRDWFTNLAFYLGVNALEHIEALADIDVNMLRDDVAAKANYILPLCMKQVARLTRGSPVFDVTAKSPDPEDQFGARVASFFLQHYDDKFDLASIRQEIAFWLVTTGNAFRFTDWNANAGRKIQTLINPFSGAAQRIDGVSPQALEFAQRAGAIQERHEGGMMLDVLSGFQVITPQGHRKIDEMPWVLLEYSKSVDWVWDNYPAAAKKISVEDFDSTVDTHYWNRLLSLINRTGFAFPASGTEQGETVRVRELWVRPSGRYPKGLWGRTLKSTHLAHGPHPYVDGGVSLEDFPWLGLPIEHYKYIPMPGRFWAISLVEQLRSPQIDYNRGRDQLDRQRDILAHPKWMAPKGAQMQMTRDEYGDFLEYENSSSGKPELQPAPNISPILVESLDRSLADMRFMSSQGEATQGDVPTGLRSGSAIRYLQEQDTSTMAPAYNELEKAEQRAQTRLLALTHAFMDVPASVRAYGEYRQADIRIFRGADLFGNISVRIRKGSMHPKSTVETEERIAAMITMGVLDPMDLEQKELILNALEYGDAEKLFYVRSMDRRRANIENQMFMRPQVDAYTGQPQPFPEVHDNDDHEAHIRVHEELLKSDAYEMMPVPRKLALEAHYLMHQMQIAQQLQVLQSMQGPPAGAGAGSAPAPVGQPSPPNQKQETPGSTKVRA